MKKWIWRSVSVLFLFYLLTGFVAVPYLIRTKVPEVVHEMTGGTLSIESVSFNPFILNLGIEGVLFSTPEEAPLLKVRRIDVNVDVVHLLWGRLSIEYFGIQDPKLFVVQGPDGRFNFDWLMHLPPGEEAAGTGEEGEAQSTLPAVVIETFDLDGGAVDFTDLSRPQPLSMQFEPIGLTLTDINTAGNGANQVHFYAGTGSGGVLDVKSTIRSFDPFALHADLRYDAGQLYLAYHFLQSISSLEVADGRIHMACTFDTNLSDINATAIDDINVSLARLRIASKADHTDVFRIGSMKVAAGPVYPLRRTAEVAGVTLTDLFVAVQRLQDGSFNWQHFFPAAAAQSGPAEANQTQHEQQQWNARINALAVRNAQMRFGDETLPQPATTTVDDFNLTLHALSTDLSKAVRYETGFALNKRGSIESNGSVTPEPLRALADVSVNGLALPPFSPYVEAKTYARIGEGDIVATSRITYAPSETDSDLTARGDFRLENLLVSDTRTTMPLVSVAALDAKAYLFELSPSRLFVDTAQMDGFYADIVVDRNKTLNLATVMRPAAGDAAPKESAAASSGTPAEPFPVRLVRFIVKNGAVHFADRSLPLPFDTQMHDVNGEVLGISTLQDETAFLHLDGEIDRYGVAKAEGSLNTGDPKAYTDIGLALRNIELSNYTPYSGKFVGRAIDRGKLSVTLRYHIVNAAMKGDNGVVINRIELGRKIDSNESVNLPLDFAIALLEDRDGIIDIDMPVEGNVDNPKFRWGGVVWKAFVNLLTKAVTAPFDLLGSLLGVKGDTLKYVPFEPGRALIDAVARERLDLLAKALEKRPKLSITVGGTYDEAKDSRALKREALIKEVLGKDAKETIGAQEALVPALLEPLYEKRLGKAALKALKKKIARLKTDEETKALKLQERLIADLIETQPLAAGALGGLAQSRAQAIRNYLTVNHAIEAVRIKDGSVKPVHSEDAYVASQIGLDAAK